MNHTSTNVKNAVSTAIDYLGLDASATLLVSASCDGAMFELLLCSEWLTYDCYVDALTGKMLGVDQVPTVDFEAVEAPFCAEILAGFDRAA